MTINYHGQIQQLYIAYFKRPADPDGLAYWQNALEQSAGNLGRVSAAFATSAEYWAAYSGLSAPAVILQIYLNLFGRIAEPAGLTYWADLLATGKLSINSIVKNVAEGALSGDKAVLANKVQAALAFTGALDTPAEVFAYSGNEANNRAKDFIATITSDASLAGALAPATLARTVFDILGQASSDTLGTGQDNLLNTGLNIRYKAPLIDGLASWQWGDRIVAGEGKADRLDAQLGNREVAYLETTTRGIETIAVQALAPAAGPGRVEMHARDMLGVSSWQSQRSSADLLIYEAHVDDSLLTSEVGIVMRETDAGDTDFGVYFDAGSLRDRVNPHHELRAQLINKRHQPDQGPLTELPYDGIVVKFNGVMTTLRSPAINAAENYDQLLAAFQAVVARTPGMETVTVSKGAPFYLSDYQGLPLPALQGFDIVFSSPTGVFEARQVAYWTVPDGIIPIDDTLNWVTTDLQAPGVASATILLDEVGRGGIGGDLVVGGNNWQTGVGRFLIEVGDDSALQTISSTAQALREVILHNGETSHAGAAGVQDRGNLSVQGATDSNVGFTDVGKIDASAMLGKISYTAQLSSAAVALYPAVGGAPTYQYLGGANDDSIKLRVDSSVLAAAGVRVNLDGGAGNDELSVTVTGEARAQAATIAFNGGEGNDLIVLPGTAGRDLLVYQGNFGDDVVRNFQAGSDALDLRIYGAHGSGFSGAGISNAADAITIVQRSAANDSSARIAALYTDGDSAAARIFIAYDSANVGKVYSVTDNAGSAVSVSFVGSIDLGATNWGSLGANNFS